MTLTGLKFKEGEDGAVPQTVTVEMSVEEALWMAIVAGRCKGDSPHSGIYDALVGDVFNRYWDDGTDGARKEIGMASPRMVCSD